jgi:AraC-like DNA-binding protein
MRWYLERMMRVLREPEPGGALLRRYLAQMMLVEVLRLYLASAVAGGKGWFKALADARLSSAMAAIALSLGYESESAFGMVFRRVMGCSPRRYGRAV